MALKLPAPLLLNVMVPVGVVLVPVEVSVTVSVQVVAAFTGSEAGIQATVVLVDLLEAVRLKVLELFE